MEAEEAKPHVIHKQSLQIIQNKFHDNNIARHKRQCKLIQRLQNSCDVPEEIHARIIGNIQETTAHKEEELW